MSSVSSSGKVAYIYDQSTDTWYPMAGSANTSQAYTWSGIHQFQNSVVLDSGVTSKSGVNNFANATARDAAITAPTNGVVVFVRNDSAGNAVNQLQYYYNGAWRVYGDNANLSDKTAGFTLAIGDGGKTFLMTSTSSLGITIPNDTSAAFPVGTQMAFVRMGTGAVSFIAADQSVQILSKNSNKAIAAQYSQALLVKRAANTWLLMGDLTA
jgi:hypothetical protein